MNNKNNTEVVLRNLVPKTAKMVNGRYKGGFVDWESEAGRAVNEALLTISKYEEILEVLNPLRNVNTNNEYLEELKKITR